MTKQAHLMSNREIKICRAGEGSDEWSLGDPKCLLFSLYTDVDFFQHLCFLFHLVFLRIKQSLYSVIQHMWVEMQTDLFIGF